MQSTLRSYWTKEGPGPMTDDKKKEIWAQSQTQQGGRPCDDKAGIGAMSQAKEHRGLQAALPARKTHRASFPGAFEESRVLLTP